MSQFSLLILIFTLSSCNIFTLFGGQDDTVPDKFFNDTSKNYDQKAEWNFANTANFNFDSNYIELANGYAALKSLQYNDFSSGTHNGSLSSNTGIQIDELQSSTIGSDLSIILPDKISSIVGHWRFDGDFLDSSSNARNGTAFGDSTSSANAKVGSAAGSFDGTGDYVDYGAVSISGPVTISAWAKIRSGSTGTVRKIASINGRKLGLQIQGNDEIAFRYNGSLFNISGSSLAEDMWHHLILTFDGSNAYLYVNNEFIQSWGIATTTLSTANFQIGADTGDSDDSGAYWNGDIDEVSLWSTSFSKEDVNLLYNKQKQKHVAIYESPIFNYGVSQDISDISFTTELPFNKEITILAELQSDYSNLNSDLSNGLIGYWPLNRDDGGFTPDLTGNANNATVLNSVSFSSQGILGNTATVGLDTGLDERIRIDNASPLNSYSQFSFSVWINTQSSGSNQYILTKSGVHNLLVNGTNNVVFQTGDGSSIKATENIVSSETLELGEWHHIVATYDGSTKYLYINGKLSSSIAAATFTNDTDNYFIGGYNASNDAIRFIGSIDDLALWDRSITSDEALELYRRGANRIKIQIRGCTDSTCSSNPNWIGPGGEFTTSFSELYNKASGDIASMFSGCSPTCQFDEFNFEGNTLENAAVFNLGNYESGNLNTQFFQYRIDMESEYNQSCSGSACLTSISDINFTSTGQYYAGSPSLVTLEPIQINSDILGVTEDSTGSCSLKYQFSQDGINFYYYDGSNWTPALDSESNANFVAVIDQQLNNFIDNGSLYFKVYFVSDGSQNCTLRDLKIQQ